MKKKKPYHILLFIGIVVFIVSYMTGISYYNGILEEAESTETGDAYKYQFDMIVDSPSSAFWQAVCESAKKSAKENQILLEMKGADWEQEYDKLDFMNMSIAAGVDGIIVEYNGESGLGEKIDEAVEKGIPVVTVMSDAPHSKRQSFVGVSDYQLGVAYGEQVANYVDEDTKDILVLLKRNQEDMNQNQIYAQISSAAKSSEKASGEIQVEGQNLIPTAAFDTEEAIHEIFQREEGPPDILVCMDEEATECARQALIDFVIVGKVKIIGSYTSEHIQDAVEKGLIQATCIVDTQQLGQYSVEALTEYLKEGRVSSYYNVDVNFMNSSTIRDMESEEKTDEEIQMEESAAGQ